MDNTAESQRCQVDSIVSEQSEGKGRQVEGVARTSFIPSGHTSIGKVPTRGGGKKSESLEMKAERH